MLRTDGPMIVCFDLGGVLVRICRSWAEGCARANLPHRSPEQLEAEPARSLLRALGERYQNGELDCAGYYQAWADSMQGLYSPDEVERIHAASTMEEYPGALQLVERLNALEHVRTACLSNTNAAHWRRLSGEDGRDEYPSVRALRHQLASHLLGCAKPLPAIYQRAQTTFFAPAEVRPERIVFFDDLPESVATARSLGWQAFTIDHAGDTVQQMRRHLLGFGIVV